MWCERETRCILPLFSFSKEVLNDQYLLGGDMEWNFYVFFYMYLVWFLCRTVLIYLEDL